MIYNDGSRNDEVLFKFYQKYWRAPTVLEFKKCGGSIDIALKTYGKYRNYLRAKGYTEDDFGRVTFVALDCRGNVNFIGTPKNIASELGLHIKTVTRNESLNVTMHNGGKIVRLDFNGL